MTSCELHAYAARIPSECHVVVSEHHGQHVEEPDPGRPAMQRGLMCWLCQQNTVLGVEHSLACQGAAAQIQSTLADETMGSLRLCHNGPAVICLHELASKCYSACAVHAMHPQDRSGASGSVTRYYLLRAKQLA